MSQSDPAGRKPGRAGVSSRRQASRGPAPYPLAGRSKVGGGQYLFESARPGTSLLFLLPLIVIYEMYAAGLIASGTGGSGRSTSHISAFLLIEELFRLMGVVARHLPAFTLVAWLLVMHIVREDRWRLHPGTPFAMAVESIGWSVPLVIMGWLAARYVPLGVGASSGRWVILCIGAGIYEEMVFRLILMTVLTLILSYLFGVGPKGTNIAVVAIGGVLFAWYHYLSPDEHFRVQTFVFRTAAGCYFGALFLIRGFGITAFSHTAYDLLVVGLIGPA